MFLKKLGLNVFGTEISADIVNKAKKNFQISKRNLKIGTSDNLNFKSNYFDFLLSWNSLLLYESKGSI